MEEWKDVKGYEGSYQVSNLGRVKSLDRMSTNRHGDHLIIGGIRTPQIISTGYETVILCNHQKRSVQRVHRLVAQAFIPNPENKKCVNHKDLNKDQ